MNPLLPPPSFSISSFHRRRWRIHLAVVNAVSIFLVNRDLGRAYRGASGVAARQITVINDLDYRCNQNAAESAGPTMTKKGDRGQKGSPGEKCRRNVTGVQRSVRYKVLRVEIANTRAKAISVDGL